MTFFKQVSCHWSDKHIDPPQSYTIGRPNAALLHLSGFLYNDDLLKGQVPVEIRMLGFFLFVFLTNRK